MAQTSLKRLLAWSSVAQAGYILAGVVVSSTLGMKATVFYLAVYLVMNLAAFAVIIARERETPLGDHIDSLAGIGATRPLLAWPMTFAMLSLAGIPATAGFIGKVYLIEASVNGNYTWLAIFIVVGSMISLAYYFRVLAAMWMRPAIGTELTGGRAGVPGVGGRPALAGGAGTEPPPSRSPAARSPRSSSSRSSSARRRSSAASSRARCSTSSTTPAARWACSEPD